MVGNDMVGYKAAYVWSMLTVRFKNFLSLDLLRSKKQMVF